MTSLLKISSLFLGISFSLRLHSPIAFGLCVLSATLLIFFEKKSDMTFYAREVFSNKAFPFVVVLIIFFSLSSFLSGDMSRSFPVIIYLFSFMFISFILYCFFKNNYNLFLITNNFFLISIFFSSFLVASYNLSEFFFENNGMAHEVKKYKGYANLLIICALLSVFIEKNFDKKKIFISYFTVPLIIPIAYLSNCNSAILGVFIGVLSVVYTELLKLLKIKNKTSVTILIFFIFSSIFLNFISKQYEENKPNEIEFLVPVNIIDAHRQIIWGFSLSNFKDNKLLGIGPDTSNFIEGSQNVIGHPDTGTMHFIPSHPHNFLIELLLETGFMGLVSFLILIIYTNSLFIKKASGFNQKFLIFFNGYFWGASLVNFSFWAAWWQGSYYLLLVIIFVTIFNDNMKKSKF